MIWNDASLLVYENMTVPKELGHCRTMFDAVSSAGTI